MKNYKQRDKKIQSKKNRMKKSGRSLLSVIEPLIIKKAIQIQEEDELLISNLSPKALIKKRKKRKSGIPG